MLLFTGFALIVLAGLMAYVRLAPADPLILNAPPAPSLWAAGAGWDEVKPIEGGAILRLSDQKGTAAELLTRIDAIAMATPATRRFAGSAERGRMTWVTRSAFWGFPDYTTAEVRADGLYIYARLYFGRGDFGVNAARLKAWLAAL